MLRCRILGLCWIDGVPWLMCERDGDGMCRCTDGCGRVMDFLAGEW